MAGRGCAACDQYRCRSGGAKARAAQEAEREWRTYSELCDAFYLYVPAGWSGEAKRICRKLRIRVAGTRTWRHILGADQIDITDVY